MDKSFWNQRPLLHMNEGTILPLKQSVYRLKALIDHPEYDSWDWNVQLSKLLDDIEWWHKSTRHLSSSLQPTPKAGG